MKTLIIHPDDRSTDFLRGIYATLSEYTLITQGRLEEINSLINSHDRIIMCGHGTELGLLSVNQFDSGSYIIDIDTVPLLKGKDCIYIWCNADKFVQKHELKGLFSGMFVSEIIESIVMGIGLVDQKVVDQSNAYFASLMGDKIHMNLSDLYHYILAEYQKFALTNIIADYNVKRIYFE